MVIIGITGTNGAGKGTVVEYLVAQKRFGHFSARALLTEEIEKRGWENNRENLIKVANELRETYGSAYVAEELFKRASVSKKNCIIESIRTVGEIELLKKKGKFVLLAVDADQKLRYERNSKRGTVTDEISLAEFVASEKKEWESEDSNKQNLKKCIEKADFLIENNGTIEELNKKVEKILNILKI
ncbi:MAG TPA: AAA family ATPase [Candidatus Woesebacteria bacterium]|jgi:dephospho-CoA kinase|nr:AAA family ATPase [Candidatus Shapirobacteria bacterium]HOR02329.1 AAA family ATPase [Candidatus Woesebacteria bacterium]